MGSKEGYQQTGSKTGINRPFVWWGLSSVVVLALVMLMAGLGTLAYAVVGGVACCVALAPVFWSGQPKALIVTYSVGLMVLAACIATASEAFALLGGVVILGLGAGFKWIHGSVAWKLALAWLACFVVAYLSGGVGGAGRFHAWLMSLGLGLEQANLVVLLVRKSIHLSAYGGFSWAVFGGLQGSSFSKVGRVLIALGWPLSFAVFDEMKQSHAVGRTGSAWDVALDFVGICLGVGLAAWMLRRRVVDRD